MLPIFELTQSSQQISYRRPIQGPYPPRLGVQYEGEESLGEKQNSYAGDRDISSVAAPVELALSC